MFLTSDLGLNRSMSLYVVVKIFINPVTLIFDNSISVHKIQHFRQGMKLEIGIKEENHFFILMTMGTQTQAIEFRMMQNLSHEVDNLH